MKPVQVLFDEPLLKRLDADAEVRRDGRSAVLRRATAEYLRRRRARDISEAYRKAYAAEGGGLGTEWAGWEDQGAWRSTVTPPHGHGRADYFDDPGAPSEVAVGGGDE